MTLVIAPAEKATNNTAKPINGDTILVYLIDRSGSMHSCWEETIGGLNTDLATQQEDDDGKTEAVFYFFDGAGFSQAETRMKKPFEGPLNEATMFDPSRNSGYAPHGSTPLYDAVGQMIMEVKDRVAVSEDNPNVLVSIFTDGGNTDHQGYSADDVKRMVETCEGEGWTFTYFGANQDAWAVGSTFGIKAGNAVSYDVNNMSQTMATASAARSIHTRMAKAAHAEGVMYSTSTYFADVGQSTDDYD